MKKVKYLLPLLLLFITINVKAIDKCTTEEMNRLKELANKIEIKTNFHIEKIEEDKNAGRSDYLDVFYTIDIINYDDDLRIFYKSLDDNKYELNIKDLNNIYFYENRKIQFQIYSYTKNLCTDELLRTISIDFPVYNRYYYYNKEKCQNNPEFEYCKEFYDSSNKTNDEIDKLYEESLNKNVAENGPINAFTNNKIYFVIIPILVISIAVIYFIFRKKKKNDAF